MAAIETYNARLDFQGTLDTLFPKGTWLMLLEEVAGKLVPAAVEFATGRVFCSDAVETELGWAYELFFDPRVGELLLGEYEQPLTLWITEFDTEHELYAEAAPLIEDEESLLVLRMLYSPKGPRRIPAGLREFITELREAELFPRGMEKITSLEVASG